MHVSRDIRPGFSLFFCLVSATGIAGTVACSKADTTAPALAEISVTPASATLTPGSTLVLEAQLRSESGDAMSPMGVFWSTSDSTVAIVNAAGVVTARKAGRVNIAATAQGASAVAALTVSATGQTTTPPVTPPTTPPVTPPVTPPTPAPVASVSLSASSSTVYIDHTVQVTATLRSASGAVLTGRGIIWSLSDDRLATVSPNGVVTGKKNGTVVVRATSEGRTGSLTLTVRKP